MIALALLVPLLFPAPQTGVLAQPSSSVHASARSSSHERPACAGSALHAGQYAGSVPLWMHPQLLDCAAGSFGPYGACLAPDGSALFVALFGGGFGNEGCRVARFDTSTLQLTGAVPTGLGPLEIAFASPTGPALGFVANSSGSSVTVFAPNLAVLATIPIPPAPGTGWSTAFPSALAVSPDQTRVYLGTNDGSGLVHVIDTTSLTRVSAETLSLGRGRTFGRMLFAGERLVVPTTRFHPGFAGSTAEVIVLDPHAPSTARITVLASSPDASAFPSPLDAALWCEAELFVCGFDLGRRLFVLDPSSGALLDEIALPTGAEPGSYECLAVRPDGLVAVGEFLTNELVWVDALSREVLGVQSLASLPETHSQLDELVFTPSGAGLIATAQFSDTLALFSLP